MRVKLIIAAAALLVLSACDDPPCPQDGVERAQRAFGSCLEMQQRGDGGFICGGLAYQTHCKARR